MYHKPATKEIAAFNTWAQREGYNMDQHPLHYIFLNRETDIARKAWKAALQYTGQCQEENKP